MLIYLPLLFQSMQMTRISVFFKMIFILNTIPSRSANALDLCLLSIWCSIINSLMSVKCFEDEKHYIVELLTDGWMLLLALLKLLENMLGTHPQRRMMRKGQLGHQFMQKGVNQTEILELQCFFNAESKNH